MRIWAMAFVAAILSGQEKPPDVTVKTGAAEVVLDLVVRDRKGRPLKDLKPEELEILEDGVPVRIKSLAFGVVGSGGSKPGAEAAAIDPLREVRLITFLFERMNREAAILARRAAMEVVSRASGTNVYFAVFLVRDRLHALQSYTNDKTALKKALDAAAGDAKGGRADALAAQAETVLRTLVQSSGQLADLKAGKLASAGPAGTPGPGNADPSAMSAFADVQGARLMLAMLQASEQMSRQRAGRPTLSALRAAVEQQRPLPGRKTLVYFSEGLQIDTSLDYQFKSVIAAANTAGVSIYCVDATGLDITERTRASSDMLRQAAQSSMETVTSGSDQPVKREQVLSLDTAEQSVRANNFTALAELASSTGGFLIADTNDLTKAAQHVAEDVNSYYDVSYVPPPGDFDGKFRRVSVRVKRPGVKAQTRTGYFALPAGAAANVAAFELPLLKVLAGTDLPTPFPYMTGLARLGGDAEHARGVVMVDVPLKGVHFTDDPAGKTMKLPLSFLAVFKDAKGNVAAKVSRELLLQLPREQAKNAGEGAFSWREQFEIAPGAYTVETAVWDRAGDVVSARREAFTAEQGGALDLSDILIAKKFEPADQTTDELLKYGDSRVTPALERRMAVVGSQGAVPLFFRLRRPAGPESPALSIRASRDGVEIANNSLPVSPQAPVPGSSYVASIPTAGLRPGAYEFTVAAIQGSTAVERTIKLDLDWAPGAGPPAAGVDGSSSEPASSAGGNEVTLQLTALKEIAGVLAPDQADQLSILEVLKQRAAGYAKSLPDFFCVQTTRRLSDANGTGAWKEQDTWQDVLSYVDGRERYAPLKLNQPESKDGARNGVSSRGELGGLLEAVFSPAAQATFHWKAWADYNGERMHVFEYTVAREHSRYALTWSGRWEGRPYWRQDPGYDGVILVDPQTLDIRRVTLKTGAVPSKFPIQEATHEIDYQVERIGDTEHLMPVRAEVRSRVGKRKLVKSEIRFREYRKWGAASTVKFEK